MLLFNYQILLVLLEIFDNKRNSTSYKCHIYNFFPPGTDSTTPLVTVMCSEFNDMIEHTI